MLKQGATDAVMQETSLPGSLGHLPPWPFGAQMQWGQFPMGNHHFMGRRDFVKELSVLPAIHNANNNSNLEQDKAGDQDSIEIGTNLNPIRRIEYLEKSINFLKTQHHELVTSLHEEVDKLQRKNKELQFCIVMMQQNLQGDKDAGSRRHSISTKHSKTKHSQNVRQKSSAKSTGVDAVTGQHEEDLTRTDIAGVDTPRSVETVRVCQGLDKLEELKLLFLEEELKELKKAVEAERKQNHYLTDVLRKAQLDKAAAAANATLAAGSETQKADVRKSAEGGQRSVGPGGVPLPFGATLDPLMVHLPSQAARPPTLRECQVIARHLQQINNRQAHELCQLKADLRDVLYSHKWTPDAYLLARAYITDDDAAETAAHPHKSLPRVPMKHATKKLPDSAYAAQESLTLPPLKTVVGNQAIERQKRTHCLQKIKAAKHGV